MRARLRRILLLVLQLAAVATALWLLEDCYTPEPLPLKQVRARGSERPVQPRLLARDPKGTEHYREGRR